MNAAKKILMIDPSALKHSSCCLALYRNLVQGYKPPVNSSDIEFGSAFHLFRKLYVENGMTERLMPMAAATKYFRETPMTVKWNKTHLDYKYLMTVCDEHADRYTYDDFQVVKAPVTGKPLVELRVVYPYASYPDIDVLFCGTIDEICYNTVSQFYAIKDYKTTSVWDAKKYLEGYRLSMQLMSYNYLLNAYAKIFPDSLIAQICKKPIGAFIDGIFLGKSGKVSFERSDVFFYQKAQMEEYEKGLAKAIAEIVGYVRRPEELYKQGMMNGTCEKVYGACQYFDVCAEPDEQTAQAILTSEFVQKQYDPRTHGATT